MNVQIKETGQKVTLNIIDDNEIDWTNDLIGNAGALHDGQFTWSDEDNAYIADQDTYDWWSNYIRDTDATDQDVESLARKLGIGESVIRERIAKNTGNDYEEHRSEAVFAMRELEEEYSN